MAQLISYFYKSNLGTIEVVGDGEAVVALRFVEGPSCEACRDIPSGVRRWLDIYFAGGKPDFVPRLCLKGTPFQLKVWDELKKIPYGRTVSYGDVARSLGCRSAQAVGQAVASNPVALIVPCHRVIGSDGSLTGYAYGIERKKKLLELENL